MYIFISPWLLTFNQAKKSEETKEKHKNSETFHISSININKMMQNDIINLLL